MNPLKASDIRGILSGYFPSQNDDFESDYIEELNELNYFGISTTSDLRKLIERNAYLVMEDDRASSEIQETEIMFLKDVMKMEDIENRIENRFWWSFPALLRLVLEYEFGERYRNFASKRDGIPN